MIKHIVDSHVHVWDLERAEYTWLENDTSILNKTYSIDQLRELLLEPRMMPQQHLIHYQLLDLVQRL